MENTDRQWEEIDETQLTIAERCVYRTRKKAVDLYQNGVSYREIFGITGLSAMAVERLWKRCCAKDPKTGESRGYGALVPKSKMKKFGR